MASKINSSAGNIHLNGVNAGAPGNATVTSSTLPSSSPIAAKISS